MPSASPLGALRSLALPARTSALSPLRHALWEYAVQSELARPGLMVLTPIRNGTLGVIDFEWLLATHVAAALLDRCGAELVGKRLLDEFPAAVGRSLFQMYCSVVSHGTVATFRCRLDPSYPFVVHRAHFAGTSIFVVLTNLKAVARQRAAGSVLRRLGALAGTAVEDGAGGSS